MSSKIELLAPGGDVDSIKAAIVAGADAIYCGLNKFNARNRADNISTDDLPGILKIAHQNDCQNILITDNEIPDLIKLLNRLVNTSIDGVIIQDLGLFYLLKKHFGTLIVHASTQCTTHNIGQIHFLNKLNAKQINLSRELNLNEIQEMNQLCDAYQIKSEVFVHGSYCISFSGQCYISSVLSGNSGNKGRCSQHCRDQFQTTYAGKEFPLNLKDNSAFANLKELASIGVSTFKIEGRIKKYEYVYTVVEKWKSQLQELNSGKELSTDNTELYKVFNRDFTNAFLSGNISDEIFIDNPLSNTVKHFIELSKHSSDDEIQKEIDELLDQKNKMKDNALAKMSNLSIAKDAINIKISGKNKEPLHISIATPETEFEICSETNLEYNKQKQTILSDIDKVFSLVESTSFFIKNVKYDSLDDNLSLSFKEINRLKKHVFYLLNGNREYLKPVLLSKLNKNFRVESKPRLSVLISSEKDIHLCDETNAQIFFQLPNSFENRLDYFVRLFDENKSLIPWFPSILIGEDYNSALSLLIRLKARKIVTNNSGIAYEAFKKRISWIAGPHLNVINSYSLLGLKEDFNCSGAFISNEINDMQLKSIKKPKDFELHYSIYHPIVLMTNRLCLFHQITGCEKKIFDDVCLKTCQKTASITNLNVSKFIVDKSEGNFNCLYNELRKCRMLFQVS
jgi:putative protease